MAGILAPPERRHRLILGPEFQAPAHFISIHLTQRKGGDSQLAIQRMSAQYRPFIARPRKRRHGDGNRDVDSDLSGLDVTFKVSCGGAVVGENGGAVAVCKEG